MFASTVKHASKVLPIALLLVTCLAFVGCGGSSGASSSLSTSSASSESSSGLSTQANQELVFGTKSATSLSIVFTNKTGAEITALSATPVSGEAAAVQLMKAEDKWPADAQATVYVEPLADGVYNLSFANGGVNRQIHNIDFVRYTEMSILIQDGLAYITATLDGNPVNTFREEYDIANPPAQEPTQEPVQEEVYYEEESYYYEEPAAVGGGGTAQTEDSCVSDVVLN